MIKSPSQPPEEPGLWTHVYAGTELALTVLICVYLGHRVDRRFATAPWGLVGGGGIGIAVGLMNFLRPYIGKK